MQRILSRWGVIAGLAMAVYAVGGCKRHTAPPAVQPVVRTTPRPVQPDFSDPMPMDTDQNPPEKPSATRHRSRPDFVPRPAPAPAIDPAVIAGEQRRQDAQLLQQQQKASQAQQQELNQQLQERMKQQQQMQDEPRIQGVPEPPASSGLGPNAPRIMDSPGTQQGSPGQETPRIQDMPGPSPQPTTPPQ